ncbi:hypothetical protein GCM10009730_56930 [Streptomyces albidochromogenes]|uniref:AAA family ATPase n=1 Tax=Streptomyces albidochromogenes TaxID=329524 RepID=UPI00110FBA1C|nr:ATP-dependent Clp protease ATP-binding subunit [Streptomyces albidochromogenes]
MREGARYADSVVFVLGRALVEAHAGRAAEAEPDHLLVGLGSLCRPDLAEVLGRRRLDADARRAVEADARRVNQHFDEADVSPRELRRSLRDALAARATPEAGAVGERRLGRAARRVFVRATELAGPGAVDAVNLLRAVLEALSPVGRKVLESYGITDALAAFFPAGAEQPTGTPYLDHYGRDLSALARAGKLPPLIGRRDELRALARVLVRRHKANAVLVGHAGTGKTGIVEGLAQRLVSPGAPADLAGARIVELSMSALVAGTKYRGEFEERLQAVLAEARGAPDVVLFIDELHTVLHAGGRGASDAANILKPALARGELRCIGATTPGEYRRDIEDDAALQRRFGVIWVDEPGRAESVAILAGVAQSLAAHHGVRIETGSAEAAVDLTVRHLPDQRLPDKAIDALDQACAAARIRTLGPDGAPAGESLRVGRDEVAAVVAERARLPLQHVAQGEAERLLAMEEHLGRRVVGQEEAVRAVAEAVRAGRSGLGDPRRPVGVLLFAGPTGIGQLTDARGRRVPFSEAVVILTSNLGADPAPAYPAGFAPNGGTPRRPAKEAVMAALRQRLRPELLGRIARVVVFAPLSDASMDPVLDKLLTQVDARLSSRAIDLTVTAAARALLLRHSSGALGGARKLEQAVDRLLVQPLAQALLTGTVTDGARVRADVLGQELVFVPVDSPAAEEER